MLGPRRLRQKLVDQSASAIPFLLEPPKSGAFCSRHGKALARQISLLLLIKGAEMKGRGGGHRCN